jgi:hypothetical protein
MPAFDLPYSLPPIFWGRLNFLSTETEKVQNVYFNQIAGERAFALFDKDYWCLSYISALHKLIQKDNSEIISVWNNGPMEQAYALLSEKEREKIFLVRDKEDAKYCFNNFRAVSYKPEVGNEYFNISVLDQKILSVQVISKNPTKELLKMEQANSIIKGITSDNVDDLFK